MILLELLLARSLELLLLLHVSEASTGSLASSKIWLKLLWLCNLGNGLFVEGPLPEQTTFREADDALLVLRQLSEQDDVLVLLAQLLILHVLLAVLLVHLGSEDLVRVVVRAEGLWRIVGHVRDDRSRGRTREDDWVVVDWNYVQGVEVTHRWFEHIGNWLGPDRLLLHNLVESRNCWVSDLNSSAVITY